MAVKTSFHTIYKMIAFSLVFTLAFSACALPTKAEDPEGSVVLFFHYNRDAGDYEDWNIWLWAEGKDGNSYEFESSDEFGVLSEIELPLDAERVGFIIRRGNWEEKDVDMDRFIEIGYRENGILNVFLFQGEEEVYYNIDKSAPRTALTVTPRIRNARFDSFDQISFTLNTELTPELSDNIELRENGQPLAITIQTDSNGGIIQLDENMKVNKKYELSIGQLTREVIKDRIFDTPEFEVEYFFDGELGAIYSKSETTFRLWSPTAESVILTFFADGHEGEITRREPMRKMGNGLWELTVKGDLDGTYYNYKINTFNEENLVADVYAKAAGVNGFRSMVVDLSKTNPEGWKDSKGPSVRSQTDVVVYELHVRDLSMDENSGIKNAGKYLGFTETATVSNEGLSTGVDSIKELGITHIHLLPVFDFHSIDESRLEDNRFNWGYDPQNYNLPEGSYSTDPFNGHTRIKEFKEMVKAIHDNGMGVIMDVVYNHTYRTDDSTFNKTIPHFYHRTLEDGSFANGSGCGNETASERAMVNKYFVDSVVYWATEYKIDGFRFDLMALHDIQLMEDIRAALDEINPEILIYGEGWHAGGSPLDQNTAALKMNASLVSDRIAFFSDDIRDGIKGSVFDSADTGFISGKQGAEEVIKYGVVGSVFHPQIDYTKTREDRPWANAPTQVVTYASAHDNLTLWDKLIASTDDATDEELVKMNKLSAAIVLTSQGMSFIHAGEELARSKDGDENSYESSDEINMIKWERKQQYNDLFEYYKGLIELRKERPAFRMTDAAEVAQKINFLDVEEGVVAYTITGNANGDNWRNIAVIFNANDTATEVTLPRNGWVVVVNGAAAGTEEIERISGKTVNIPAKSAYVLVDTNSFGK